MENLFSFILTRPAQATPATDTVPANPSGEVNRELEQAKGARNPRGEVKRVANDYAGRPARRIHYEAELDALLNAIISALDAHNSLSTQALNSETVRDGLKDILLGQAQLYEALRARAEAPSTGERRYCTSGRLVFVAVE